MQIKEWGEENFIEHLARNFNSDPSILGIGDDCAVIPTGSDLSWLVTTDALVEGIHFLKGQISAKDLGYKTIAVNVSDIAAMGGRPHYAFLSIALPKETEQHWLCEYIEGIKSACTLWNIQLLGGDTVGSKRDLFINLTLVGSANSTEIKYRSQAKAGDIICTNGTLGDSAAGLKCLQENIKTSKNAEMLIKAHFHPNIELEQGIWLASKAEVHAMMDLSDGLNCDLKRMMRKSKCGASIETAKLPLSQALLNVCLTQDWDPQALAVSGGEDYTLLFTVASDKFEELQRSFQRTFKSPLYAIGHITPLIDVIQYICQGKEIEMNQTHFDHFQ